jgi:hypothetical protein
MQAFLTDDVMGRDVDFCDCKDVRMSSPAWQSGLGILM